MIILCYIEMITEFCSPFKLPSSQNFSANCTKAVCTISQRYCHDFIHFYFISFSDVYKLSLFFGLYLPNSDCWWDSTRRNPIRNENVFYFSIVERQKLSMIKDPKSCCLHGWKISIRTGSSAQNLSFKQYHNRKICCLQKIIQEKLPPLRAI